MKRSLVPRVMLVLLVAVPQAQEVLPDNGNAYLEGATNPNPVAQEEKARLIAPHVRANRVDLPPTTPPYRGDASSGETTAPPIPQVGYTIDAPPHLIAQAKWEHLAQAKWEHLASQSGKREQPASEGGWVCHLELRSANAVGLRLLFQGQPDPRMVIQIYHPNGSIVLPARAYPEGYWWAPTLWYSDAIGVEIFVPERVDT